MKIQLLRAIALVCSSIIYGQVGINTTNPQGIFHVDGAKDNSTTGTPTSTQQINDVIVTSTGSMNFLQKSGQISLAPMLRF